MSYDDEPDVRFIQVSEEQYCKFYNLEMHDFVKDVAFYLNHIATSDKILEFGCGSGRLTRHLFTHCAELTGVDISKTMIEEARKAGPSSIKYLIGDMLHFTSRKQYDHIIIPYNTINLLKTEQNVLSCLETCNTLLKPGGTLLLQIFIPTESILQSSENAIFQFAIFQQSAKCKIIKETLKRYCPITLSVCMEERYRVRPEGERDKFEDLNNTYTLFTPPLNNWKGFLQKAKFTIDTLQFGYSESSDNTADDTVCMIKSVK